MWNLNTALPSPTLANLPDSLSEPVMVALNSYRLLVVEGEQAETFLQGQCTCDFKRLDGQAWLLGAHCDAKGRMQSSFIAARLSENRIALRVHASIAEHALNALKKYIVFSKAEISVQPALVLGVIHTHNVQADVEALDIPKIEAGSFYSADSAVFLRRDAARTEIWITSQTAAQRLVQTVAWEWASENCWKAMDFKQGLAEITAKTAGELLPHELNFQLTDGIAFNKGCYTGQEIVARMQYRGKLKKHLYLAETRLSPQEQLVYGSPVERHGKVVGKVIDALHTGGQHWFALALVNDDATEGENTVIGLPSQPILRWKSLPYAIPK